LSPFERLERPLVVFALALIATACGGPQALPEATEFADRYLDTMIGGQREELFELYLPEFFDRTSREQWIERLARVEAEIGRPVEFSRIKWTMEALPNGAFVTFEYRVTYTEGTAHETITVVKPVKTGELGVFGHHIRPES
jgi:hypothetical protein